MSKHKWDTSLLRLVIQHLRVPELFYPFELGSSDALIERSNQTKTILATCKFEFENHEETLLKQLQKLFDGKGTFTQANNLGFLIDRVFDVWIRKNQFPDQLQQRISQWRFAFYRIVLLIYCANIEQREYKIKEKALNEFIVLLESISNYVKCWNPLPKRSQSLLLDQLTALESTLDSAQEFDAALVESCSSGWFGFLEKQNDKVDKITKRLTLSEAKKNKNQFSLWLAHHYLNVLFNKRTLPQVLQDFLQEHWVLVVAKKIEETLPETIDTKEAIIISQFNEPLDTLCKNIVRVFCHKGESGFQLADQIIDDMQKASRDVFVSGSAFSSERFSSQSVFFSEEAAWEGLSDALVSLLQGQDSETLKLFKSMVLPEHLLHTFGSTEEFKEGCLTFESLKIHLNDWFVLNDDGLTNIKFSAHFKQSKQLLFSNYLGMKCAQFSYSEFHEKLNSGVLTRKSKGTSFENVFEQAVRGLSKIADNQKKARLVAAEKAKEEAERLLEDRRKADELSNQRAEEIAQRTQQLKAKRADKQRLEKENATLELMRAFKLGAWIAIHSDGAETQRFKLVVKLAATGKYVFVDRLGVKKLEFLEADLMTGIQTEKIEVLSDGAEFEDSLQRVVSRLRISK